MLLRIRIIVLFASACNISAYFILPFFVNSRDIHEAFAGQYSGEILRPPDNSVPQTTVFRYQEIGGKLCAKQRSNGIVYGISIEYLDGYITFFSMLPTQYITNFLVAEYYGLRNTIFWESKNLASGL
jgi:hypothetical protein